MKARQLFRYKGEQDSLVVEMVIWELPDKTRERPHSLKYRLYCGRGGNCIVRYDNEAGKGDHRHYENREERYEFTSLDRLLQDFQQDCTRLAGWRRL